MRSERIEDIFAECLERVFSGDSIEECVSQYPGQADELKGLLKTAMATRRAAAVSPGAEFQTRARLELQEELRKRETAGKEPRWYGWIQQPGWAAGLAAFLVLLMSGSGVVLAANNSMPGEPLYSIKTAAENVRLTATTNPTAKSEVYAGLVERRVSEIIYLANNGDAKQLEKVTANLGNYLAEISELSGGVAQNMMLAAKNKASDGERGGLLQESFTTMAAPETTVPIPASADTQFKSTGTTNTGLRNVAILSKGNYVVTANDEATARLIARIYYQSNEVPALLKSTLEKATAEVRIALIQAIAVSETGYERVLQSLQ